MSAIKKFVVLLMIFSLTLSLCACKSRTEKDNEDEQKGARENWEEPQIIPEKPEPAASATKPEPPEDQEYNKAFHLAENLMIAARSGTREGIQQYADYNTLFGLREDQGGDWILQQILMRMRYESESGKADGDKASVPVIITNVDMTAVLPLYYEKAMQLEYDNALADSPLNAVQLETEYQKIFAELMLKNEAVKVEKEAEIKLEKRDGEWKIIPDEKLGNAMLGGYLDAQNAIRENPPHIQESEAEHEDSVHETHPEDDEMYVYSDEHGEHSMYKPRE